MRHTIALLSLSCLLSILPATAHAEGGAGAIDAFRAAQGEVVGLVDAKADPGKIAAKVDALLDYEWIAQSALGGPTHYAERCAERCAEFEALLAELIRRNYLERIQAKGRGEIEVVKEHVRETATKVDTRVTYKGKNGKLETVEVDYVLHQDEKQKWHVRDIITEGVSLAKNYKYEINQLYKKDGINGVNAALQKRIDELDRTQE